MRPKLLELMLVLTPDELNWVWLNRLIELETKFQPGGLGDVCVLEEGPVEVGDSGPPQGVAPGIALHADRRPGERVGVKQVVILRTEGRALDGVGK